MSRGGKREGAGRKMGIHREQLNIRVTPECADYIKSESEKRGISLGVFIELCVKGEV